jgi:type IV pilus assembly protein PilE
MKHKRSQGITLIELMIVVVVVGILAAIAYPSYQRFIQNARMATAQGDLLELAQFVERRYTATGNTYAGITLPFAISPREDDSIAYNLSFVGTPDADTFTIQAVPIGGQTGHRCGTMTINQAGERTAADSNCWR